MDPVDFSSKLGDSNSENSREVCRKDSSRNKRFTGVFDFNRRAPSVDFSAWNFYFVSHPLLFWYLPHLPWTFWKISSNLLPLSPWTCCFRRPFLCLCPFLYPCRIPIHRSREFSPHQSLFFRCLCHPFLLCPFLLYHLFPSLQEHPLADQLSEVGLQLASSLEILWAVGKVAWLVRVLQHGLRWKIVVLCSRIHPTNIMPTGGT